MGNNPENNQPVEETELNEEALNQVGGGYTELEIETQMLVDPQAKREVSGSNMLKKLSKTQDTIIKNLK